MKKENTTQPNVEVSKTSTSIYNEDNLITGLTNQEEVKKEFDSWFKVKIKGQISSYLLHEDGSLQLKFQETVEKTLDGITYDDVQDKSIRIRQDKPFTQDEAKSYEYKNVEIIDVTEKAQYKKISEGQYDFNKVEKYYYSANNVKIINESVLNNYELFKIFEVKVKNIAPSLKYDQRKRKQIIDKTKSILMYEVEKETLKTLHKITVNDMTFTEAQKLKNKDIVIMDLQQIGKTQYCSKIKLK